MDWYNNWANSHLPKPDTPGENTRKQRKYQQKYRERNREDTKFYVPTLRHGTLTAEQVRETVLKRGNVMGPRFYGDWQAIADELNAMMDCESANELIDRARDMARNIQGNLGRNLYRQKDAETLQEASATLMELANELSNTRFQLNMARDDLDRFIDNMNEMIDEEVRERLDSR